MTPLLPLDMVDKSTSLSKPIWGRFFVILQSREAFSSRSEVHPSLSAGTSAVSPRQDTAPTSGFDTPQAETFGNGQESTSRAVHRWVVLPAAIAGVRCR